MEADSLPLLTEPHDAVREGLVTLKDATSSAHPVETIQKARRKNEEQSQLEMLEKVYGSALPARLQIERQILNRVERLPGLPSSKLGLESITGELDDFSFESYLNLPTDSEVAPPDVHSQMEAKLGLATKPASRGIV